VNFVMFLVSKNRDDFLTSLLAVSQVDFLPAVVRAVHLFSRSFYILQVPLLFCGSYFEDHESCKEFKL
jgi:hypothetical protein